MMSWTTSLNNEQKCISISGQVRYKDTDILFEDMELKHYVIQLQSDIDSFLDVYMSKHAKRLDCQIPGTIATRPMKCKDWYSFLNPAEASEIFFSNTKKLCYIFEHKMKDNILWVSFVGYVLMRQGVLLDSNFVPERMESVKKI